MNEGLYRQAFLDWMACAYAGRNETAPAAARGVGDGTVDRVLSLAAAGHVLDFDDTYAPGLSHLSAPTAPAALVVAAVTRSTIGDALEAYAAGFEAMAAVARASHPALYDRGWHPTAIAGTIGAATAAAHLLGFDESQTRTACHLAVLGAGGLRAAFGTDGKSLQVGMASAAGVRAALLTGWGATATGAIEEGFAAAYGGVWAQPGDAPAVVDNWIKAFPCCLQTHGAIEAAEQVSSQVPVAGGAGIVTVHPVSRQAAPLDDVRTGLEAKFSIPYTVAFTLIYGTPTVESFITVDDEARSLASRIEVKLDDSFDQSATVLTWENGSSSVEIAVDAARGSPQQPMNDAQLTEKVHSLAGVHLDGALDDVGRPAAKVLALLEVP